MPLMTSHSTPIWLRPFSKVLSFLTLLLIFVGGMVTSTGSGLSVPDWPLSYGSFFPPMVGGVFYEHGHRMVASGIGFLTLCLAISLWVYEKRWWVKKLGFFALGAVIMQGVLGGLTVLFFLPPPISIGHAVLAQIFFILTIIIAYSQSIERQKRTSLTEKTQTNPFLKVCLLFSLAVYFQLIIGGIMRHTKAGLAIPDFPTMGGQWWPQWNEAMMNHINYWRFEHDFAPVTLQQVLIHFLHRLQALVILIVLCLLNGVGLKYYHNDALVRRTIYGLNFIIALQIILGILAVLTLKEAILTSIHVMTGAATLGLSIILILRVSPIQWKEFKKAILP